MGVLEKATYEVRVNPYRGILPFFSLLSAIDGKSNDDDYNNHCCCRGGTIDEDQLMEDEDVGGGGGGGGGGGRGMVGIPPMISERPLLRCQTRMGVRAMHAPELAWECQLGECGSTRGREPDRRH